MFRGTHAIEAVIVLDAGAIIWTLKIAVCVVTVLLALSLTALWRGRYRLHGRINVVFFILTLAALVGLEVVARLIEPELFRVYFDERQAWTALWVHLCFSLPSALLLLLMLPTGWRRRRKLHIALGLVFLVFWTGTFITGVFFLPHQ